MLSVNYVKHQAKTALNNKWPAAVAIGAILLSMLCLLIVVFSIFCTVFSNYFGNAVSSFLSVIPLLLIGQFFSMPLVYGMLRWFWFTVQGASVPISEIFCYFSNGREYARAISLSFRVFCRVVAIIVLCYLPSIIITLVCQPEIYNFFGFPMPYFVSSLWGIGNMMEVFGAILSVILLLRYFAAPILMINNSDISPQEALHLSVIISKQANGKTFLFLLSFIGWAILSLLVLPLLYAAPYFLASYSVYCKHLIDNYNNIVSIQNQTYYPHYQPPKF